jgi:hypothetical protein
MKLNDILNNPLHFTEEEKDKVLERFMKEFFHFPTLCKVGFFTKEMKGDYKAQAEMICKRFGFESIYEYGLTAKHVKIGDGFWNEMKSIYESRD